MAFGIKERIKEGDSPKPTRYFSNRQEKAVAKAIGGKQTANSGATDFGGKSDVHTEDWSIECKTKTTNCDSISIKKDWIEKLKRESAFDGKKYTAVAISFGPDSENYYIIDEYLFQDLIEYLKIKQE